MNDILMFRIKILSFDALFAIATFVLSIFCIVKEIQYQSDKSSGFIIYSYYNYRLNSGAFVVAGVSFLKFFVFNFKTSKATFYCHIQDIRVYNCDSIRGRYSISWNTVDQKN